MNIGCPFCLYYTLSAEEMLVCATCGVLFGFGFFKKKKTTLIATERKCVLLTTYCPLAAESSFSTFLPISLPPVSPKCKVTG